MKIIRAFVAVATAIWRDWPAGLTELAERATGEITINKLRESNWRPARKYPCGCNPCALCAYHAHIRAVEHYHPEAT